MDAYYACPEPRANILYTVIHWLGGSSCFETGIRTRVAGIGEPFGSLLVVESGVCSINGFKFAAFAFYLISIV